MFAVIILGIGFIMVAAIFPVALQQTKNTSEEVVAANIGPGAVNYIGQVASDAAGTGGLPGSSNIPATGTAAVQSPSIVQQVPINLPPGGATFWNAIRGNMVLPDDPRYAWVMLYRRDGNAADAATWSPFAQVYVFTVQSRGTPRFVTADSTLYTTNPWTALNPIANLMARPVRVAIADAENTPALTGGPDLIAFDYTGNINSDDWMRNVDAATEGAYVIIANDQINALPANTGRMNGRIYRLGARRTDMDNTNNFRNTAMNLSRVYELQPGNDFNEDFGDNGVNDVLDDIVAIGNTTAFQGTSAARTADAFVIGRGYAGGTAPNYEGTNMAITAFTAIVKVNR